MSALDPRTPQNAPPAALYTRAIPPAQSQWPMVLGVIAIVFGAVGALMNACGALAPLLIKAALKAAPQNEGASALAAQSKYAFLTSGLAFLSMIVAFWLLAGGILLLKRRRVSVVHLTAWALLKFVLVIIVSIMNYGVTKETMQNMESALKAEEHQVTQGFEASSPEMLLAMSVFALLWGWALPIFILRWFNRHSVKAEIRTWS